MKARLIKARLIKAQLIKARGRARDVPAEGPAGRRPLRAGLVAGLPGARVVGALGVRVCRRHRVAPPGPPGADAGRQPAPGDRPGPDGRGTPRAAPGGHALLRTVLAGGGPAPRGIRPEDGRATA